VHCQVA